MLHVIIIKFLIIAGWLACIGMGFWLGRDYEKMKQEEERIKEYEEENIINQLNDDVSNRLR